MLRSLLLPAGVAAAFLVPSFVFDIQTRLVIYDDGHRIEFHVRGSIEPKFRIQYKHTGRPSDLPIYLTHEE